MTISDTNIFGKKLSDVTTKDVRNFCEKQIREGINLDYKAQIDKSISKTIAAMANTLGGWIIIGVDDNDDKPKAPYAGIDFEQSMELRITTIVIDKISPPALPLVHVCPADDDNKTFIILYVAQSPEAPHWLFNENKLPIRLNDRTSSTDWERLANSDEWEYLRMKRQRSEALFNKIYQTLDDLFVSYDDKSRKEAAVGDGLRSSLFEPMIRMKDEFANEDKINILVAPKYPHKKLFNPESETELARELRIHDRYSGGYFPSMSTDFLLFQHGLHNYYANQTRDDVGFFAIDKYGMLLLKEKIVEQVGSDTFIDLERILVRYKQMLLFAKLFYEKFGYYGELEIRVVIEGYAWMKLKMSEVANFHENLESPMSTISHETNSQLQLLNDEKHVNFLVAELYKDVANAFRWDIVRRRELSAILSVFGL